MALLKGKTALVTGGAKGLGKAIAEALLRRQVKVCIADLDEVAGNKTTKDFQDQYGTENVIFSKCDVSSNEEFEATFVNTKAKFGHIDILINNAGIGGEDQWSKVIDVNLKGVMQGTLLALKHLTDEKGEKGGHVINTSSIVGLRSSRLGPAYSASKHGVIGWSKSWGDKLNASKTKVKVNVVCPKLIDETDMTKTMCENSIDKEAAEKFVATISPFAMKPKEVAEAYIQLLLDDVTGSVLVVCPEKGRFYHKSNPDI